MNAAIERELRFSFIRSSGPGGQSVNKVSTAVQLRFDVLHSRALSSEAKVRLLKQAGRRITQSGVLVLEAHRFRSQEKNRADAIARFAQLVLRANQRPSARHETAPSSGAREKRLRSKKQRGKIKKLRTSGIELD